MFKYTGTCAVILLHMQGTLFLLHTTNSFPPLHDDQTIQSHDGRHSYKLALMRFALDRALNLIHSLFPSSLRGEAPYNSGNFRCDVMLTSLIVSQIRPTTFLEGL